MHWPINSGPPILTFRHFLQHFQQYLSVALAYLGQEFSKLVQCPSAFAGTPEFVFSGFLAVVGLARGRRLLPIVEKMKERHLKSPCHLFKRLDSRNGVTILDS
jgi:hypothetical protein